MEFSVQKGNILEQSCDLLIINSFAKEADSKQKKQKIPSATGDVNDALDGALAQIVKEEKFTANLGETLLIRTRGKLSAKRLLLVGLGKKEEFSLDAVREVAAVTAIAADKLGVKRVVSILHGAGQGKLSAKECARAIVEGAQLGLYRFESYKKKKQKINLQSFTIISKDARHVLQAKEGVLMAELSVAGVVYARDLVNTPSGHMQPRELVEKAKEITKESKGKIKIKIMDLAALKKMKAGALLGVAQGSDHPPYMVHLSYRPTGAKKHLALVGKAVTFDSGGLSLKPAEAMYTMKLDMAGAAAVLGVFSVLAKLKPNIKIDGIFAACENMPSGKAIRPGDVVTAMNGTTIEVLHTDAEGRVTLADALSYAVKQKPDAIVDLATLTGACMVALGEEITGLMSNDQKLQKKILDSAEESGEKMWALPLEKNYKRELKSEVADLKNLAGRYGGALTAGLFLQEFVEKVPWAHLDIAGPSFAERPINAYTAKGATGVGVRTLIELIKSF